MDIMYETAKKELYAYLDTLPLITVRVVGRKKGLNHSSSGNKDELINGIIDLLTGKTKPEPKSKRGAPPKNDYVDPVILRKIDDILFEAGYLHGSLEVHQPDAEGPEETITYQSTIRRGILEITSGGYGFLRAHNCQPSVEGDVFLPSSAIHNLKLREGDVISCSVHPRTKTDSPAMAQLMTVNGLMVGNYERRPFFDSLTAKYPCEKIALSEGCDDLSLRVLDLFVPIGKGQRALIIAPPKAGKTTLLKAVARSVSEHHPDIHLIVLLIDERPEEVTDFRTSVPRAEVVYSTFDEGAEHHIRAASLTLAHAKRLAEHGKHVLILLDSLTKLTRAYNYAVESTGKTLSGGLDAGALAEPKRFFGAARNTVEGGSITILATALVDTGSRMDDIIYEEFKGTGNADIFLSRELAERRVFPAIDVRRSGTRKEELLLPQAELDAVYKMRERGLCDNMQGLLDMLRRTKSNADFIARLPEWIRVFKN